LCKSWQGKTTEEGEQHSRQGAHVHLPFDDPNLERPTL
jgi:hypothetical protein